MRDPGRTLVLITARGGSKGLPGKNLREVGGISLVGRAVKAGGEFALQAGLPDGSVVLDTDDEAIAAEGRAWGARVPFLRAPELARDATSSVDTVLGLVDRLAAAGEIVDTIVLLQPTAPLREAGDVAAGWQTFRASDAPLVVSLVRADHPPEFSVRLDDGGGVAWAFAAVTGSHRRQDLRPAYRPNGAVYIVEVEFLRRRRSFFLPGEMRGYLMEGARSVDIDSALDLRVADAVLAEASPPRWPLLDRPPDRTLDVRDGAAVDRLPAQALVLLTCDGARAADIWRGAAAVERAGGRPVAAIVCRELDELAGAARRARLLGVSLAIPFGIATAGVPEAGAAARALGAPLVELDRVDGAGGPPAQRDASASGL